MTKGNDNVRPPDGGVDYERQRKAFETCGNALNACTKEERVRTLAALVVMFGDDEHVLARIERSRLWR